MALDKTGQQKWRFGVKGDLISNPVFDNENNLYFAISDCDPYVYSIDQNGNHTGPLLNGDFEVNIPGSSYDTLDDAKFIWLPDNGQYTIKFESTGAGTFDFRIRKYEYSENNKTIIYKNIPLAQNTKAELFLIAKPANCLFCKWIMMVMVA